MLDSDLIGAFISVTEAPESVAEHLLEAHGGDLDAAVSFYLESGGVGHGVVGSAGPHPQAARHDSPPRQRPLAASEPPRSSPIEVSERLCRRSAVFSAHARPRSGTGAFRAHPSRHPAPPVDLQILDEDEEDDGSIAALASSLGRRGARRYSDEVLDEPSQQQQQQQQPNEVDLVDSDDEGGGGRTRRAPRRVRRNRPRGAAEVDPALVALGEPLSCCVTTHSRLSPPLRPRCTPAPAILPLEGSSRARAALPLPENNNNENIDHGDPPVQGGAWVTWR